MTSTKEKAAETKQSKQKKIPMSSTQATNKAGKSASQEGDSSDQSPRKVIEFEREKNKLEITSLFKQVATRS